MSDIVLEYNGYELWKFINALKQYIDEAEFKLDKDGLRINFMDPSRIMIAEVEQPYNTFLEHNGSEIKVGLNVDDLERILRTKKSAKKTSRLEFTKDADHIIVEKHSPILRNVATLTLAVLDIDVEDIPMDNLKLIEYDSKGVFELKYLKDYMYQSGRYSELVYTIIDNKGFHFKEEGAIGTLDYLIDGDLCVECKGTVSNAYSLAYFNPLKPLLEILPDDAIISFSLKKDHPIRIELSISSLEIKMMIFLAPRVEEKDWDDDDEDDEF